MERSLEALTKRNEENWLSYVDFYPDGTMELGTKFNCYKQEIVNLRSVLEKHFDKNMKDIRDGLQDVIEDEAIDDLDYGFDGGVVGQWTCRICQVVNEKDKTQCTTC